MARNAQILVQNSDGEIYDFSGLIAQINWGGRKGAPARSLEVTFIDDDSYNRARSHIDVEKGSQVLFYWKEEELFRGLFMSQEQSDSKTMSLKAYDRGIYLSNNDDTFCYSYKTASHIFADCCKRFNIQTGDIVNTEYEIPELVKPDTTLWDVIADALSITYKETRKRYYPLCRGEAIHLIERRMNVSPWVIQLGKTLKNYSYSKSIEGLRTRIILKTRDGDILQEAENAELEQRFGTFQKIQRNNDEMNEGELYRFVNSVLAENNESTQSLDITATGLPDVISGTGIVASISSLDISKAYYVDQDSHTFEGNSHFMSLQLVPARDII